MLADFKTMDEFLRYFDSTICMFEGQPVVVRVTQNNMEEIRVSYLNKKDYKIISYKHEAFQTFPFELGFVNLSLTGQLLFLSRNGVRKSNYGLSISNIYCETMDRSPLVVSMNSIIASTSMNDCLTNTYPSIIEALNTVSSGKNTATAFHKYYYIGIVDDDEDVIGIYFMDNEIPFAIYNSKTKTFSIGVKTKRNSAFYSVACKSGTIPSNMIGV